MKCFGSINGGPWAPVSVLPSSAIGKARLQNPDGTIVSIQPNGAIESRPAGTDNAYEQCLIQGTVAVYATDGKAIWPFALWEC